MVQKVHGFDLPSHQVMKTAKQITGRVVRTINKPLIKVRGRVITQYRDRFGAWQFDSDKAASGTKVETRLGITKKIDGGLTLG
ncbi:MAG: hypothetical protein ACJA0G_001721 [Kangiellaceae bacterium]|jgi:hypothetical protein